VKVELIEVEFEGGIDIIFLFKVNGFIKLVRISILWLFIIYLIIEVSNILFDIGDDGVIIYFMEFILVCYGYLIGW
jgi:hypothetical protein